MNSKDYWAKRSALDMIQYMRTADETTTLIRQTAEQALEVIQNEIKGIFSAFTSFGISEADAKRILSGSGTVLQQMRRAAEKLTDPKQKQALLSAINSAGAYRFRIQRLEEVSKQITEQCKELYKAQLEATETALRSVAEDAYYHTMFNLQKETGLAFSFAQFPKKQIDKILAFNWSGAHFSQRIWRNTEILAQAIKDEMLVSLLSGRSNAKTMQVIREQFNVNSFCAWRLVRTESSYISNAAVSEGYKEADIEKYHFIATLDSRTSEECAALDGKVFLLADKKVGTNFPPMHPFCRSTTIADFGEETLKSLQRRARDKEGKVMKVPADMTYEEWAKENGINAAKPLDKSGGSGIIKVDREREVEQMLSSVEEKQFAAGNRRSPFYELTDKEIEMVKAEIIAIGANPDDFVFNSTVTRGTCFLPSDGKVHIKGNIFPDDFSEHPRDKLTVRAVLAHEYYGHRPYRKQYLAEDSVTAPDALERIYAKAWADEFRASYMAAKNAPNLSDEERGMLILDSLSRAEEAGITIKYNEFIRRVLYG